jgi:hypothetical protein
MKRTLSTLLITFFLIDLAILSLCPVASQMLDVGGDFGKSWLVQFSNKFADSDTAARNATPGAGDLWSWGGRPLGYEVIGGRLIPVTAQPEYYYPFFMTNSTPIIINGTTNTFSGNNNLPLDFLSPAYTTDPWFLAQITDRPVIVVYPVNNRGSTLI